MYVNEALSALLIVHLIQSLSVQVRYWLSSEICALEIVGTVTRQIGVVSW